MKISVTIMMSNNDNDDCDNNNDFYGENDFERGENDEMMKTAVAVL